MHLDIQPSEIWMIFGFFLIFIELIKLPGLGFLFLGLGGLTVAILIASEKFTLDLYMQVILFVLASTIWFALLWKPLKIFNSKIKSKHAYNDMMGEEVVVINDKITPGFIGQVKWSGTIMNATLVSDSSKVANIGDSLIIKEIKGNILICSFKE